MAAYRVCIVVPPGYPHAACFTEAALLLRHSLLSLGYDCDLALNEFARNRVNIVLGTNLLNPAATFGDCRVILYQLEQLSDTEGWYSDGRGAMLARAEAVWDYSPENVEFLRQRGIAASYVPLGFHPALQTIPDNSVRDIAVLFVGSLNDRRRAVLSALEQRGYVVKVLFGVYGKQRDDTIARSRVVINIHFYEANIFEAVRVSYLVNNGVFVLSEDSTFYPWDGVPIPRVAYGKLVESCDYWLRDDAGREALRKEMASAFKERYPMTEIVSQVLRQAPGSRFGESTGAALGGGIPWINHP
jgi:hypothetical protein